MSSYLVLLGSLLVPAATGYAVLALLVPNPRRAATRRAATDLPAVSVLKPLCGAETRLYDNLCSLCVQTHPQFQIVCGVRDPNDPAIAIVERVRAAYPGRDIELVIDPRVHGSNLKVSNLMNLVGAARHEVLVVADSDIGVPTDYLERLADSLCEPGTGLVTCLYRGRPIAGFWPRIGSHFIDAWFIPSVRVAHWFGAKKFGFGATLALRRETLELIGGFTAVRNRLADDYWIGQLVGKVGLGTRLSEVWVTTEVSEIRLRDLWNRELRWLRTIRSLNPIGFFFTFVTCTLPVLALGLALAPSSACFFLAAVGLSCRLLIHWRRPNQDQPALRAALYAPLRDLLLLAGWAWALVGSEVQWREQVMPLQDGSVDPHS